MTESPEEPLLSIIIPAYNEENRLPASLEQVAAFVAAQSYAIEVIIVDNNSIDRTAEIAGQFAAEHPYARVLTEPRKGKGMAVRTGILDGRGEYLIFCDADFSMPVEEIGKFVPPALSNYDVAIASREAPGAQRIGEPEYRHLMGRIFNLIVRIIAIPGIQDTQCGFKAFRREVAQVVFPLLTIGGWGFDVEVLFVSKQYGYKLIEVPISWYHKSQSRVSPMTDSAKMVWDVLRVRWNGLRGVYRRGES
ncbi:MAG: glycosyltransferase family 2 protein [Anaerolineae bacterium]|nr:glycosyltransferase family 2 protein [Anaerolineae bacterium]